MEFTSHPAVSIIIPCYNMGQYLNDALDSIYGQTFKSYEIIIINDGSTDTQTLDLLKRLDKSKVQVIHQVNQGLPVARNVGIKKARGAYITCLDADDKYSPNFLKYSVQRFEKDSSGKIGFVGVQTRLFGLRDDLWKPLPYNPVQLLQLNFFHSATMFRKAAWKKVGGYNETMQRGYQDWDFWLALVEAGYEWNVIEKELLFYRIRENSMVTQSNQRHAELYKTITSNHTTLFKKHASDLASEQMNLLVEKDNLINRLNEALKQEHEQNEKLYKQNNELWLRVSRAEQSLDRLRNTKLFRTYKYLRQKKKR